MGSLTMLPKLLVVDFNKDGMKPGTYSWIAAGKDIRQALEHHGCFIALYDCVSSDLNDRIFHSADQLFELPLETKVKNINGKPYHGYVGQMPIVPLHEGLGIDYATTVEGAQSFTNIMWPNGNNFFCKTSMEFATNVAGLDQTVIRMLFGSYGLDEKYTDSHIESTTYLLRYLKYRAPEIDESNKAFPSHTDKSFITILYQNQVSGLEIRTRDGDWINVEFPPSSFVVMAGDAAKGWSNGRILSPSHRVTLDKEGKGTRYSMGLFSFISKTVQVPEEMIDDENPLRFKPFKNVDLLTFYGTEVGRRSQDILKDFCGV